MAEPEDDQKERSADSDEEQEDLEANDLTNIQPKQEPSKFGSVLRKRTKITYLDTVSEDDCTNEDLYMSADDDRSVHSEDSFSDTCYGPYGPSAFKGKKGMKKKKSFCKKKKVKCEFCTHVAASQGDLNKHYRKHGEKTFFCPVDGCDHASRYPGNIKHHMRRHSDWRPFQCETCLDTFKTKSSLDTHMKRHSDDKPIHCDKCPFTCKRNFELTSHYRYAHTTERKFQCHICQRKFKFNSDRLKHLRTHDPRKDIQCEQCGKAFGLKSALRQHMAYMHNFKGPYHLCTHCGKQFKDKHAMEKHISVVHEKIKPISCSVCNAKFANTSNLRIHLRTHDVNRTFVCPVCHYRGINELELRSHIGHIHSEYYFVNYCGCCKKKFKKKHLLRQHILTELHKSNIKKGKWKNGGKDVFEYRLEPRKGYTKKSSEVSYMVGTAPQIKTEPFDHDEIAINYDELAKVSNCRNQSDHKVIVGEADKNIDNKNGLNKVNANRQLQENITNSHLDLTDCHVEEVTAESDPSLSLCLDIASQKHACVENQGQNAEILVENGMKDETASPTSKIIQKKGRVGIDPPQSCTDDSDNAVTLSQLKNSLFRNGQVSVMAETKRNKVESEKCHRNLVTQSRSAFSSLRDMVQFYRDK